MPNLNYISLNHANRELTSALMNAEEQSWRAELDWDYSPVRQILASFLEQEILPGYVATDGLRALGYTYFLIHDHKGIIGTVYTSKPDGSQEVADEIVTLAIDCLKETDTIERIESQVIPFNDLSLNAVFMRHGFQYYPRYYLKLDLASYPCCPAPSCADKIVLWDPSYISHAAQVVFRSYRNQMDALICEDYCSTEGCESYLHSLVENPGCGIFIKEGSFIGLDSRGLPCGFIMSSRISSSSAMIPQISILPSHQGRGLGRALIHRSLSHLKAAGFRNAGLTVTQKNRRAFEWYQRLGFKIGKEFGAYVWQRPART